MISRFLPAAFLVVSACTAENTNSAQAEAEIIAAAEISPASPMPASDASALPAPTVAARQKGDLAPCPGINPDIRRPAGSNCLGITLDQCGADKVMKYIGQIAAPDIRRTIQYLATDNARWYYPGDALIENLDPSRLNVELDTSDRITKIDCF